MREPSSVLAATLEVLDSRSNCYLLLFLLAANLEGDLDEERDGEGLEGREDGGKLDGGLDGGKLFHGDQPVSGGAREVDAGRGGGWVRLGAKGGGGQREGAFTAETKV